MNSFADLTNTYSRRARLRPAMIIALPLALATLAWFPKGILGWGTFWSLFVWCGGTALAAQVARDAGKRKEPELFRRWGGKPTTRLLRHRDSPNKIVLERRHRKLGVLLGGVAMPTTAGEASDPDNADHIYDACTALLLERTRDRKKYELLFEENCNYGFRRNLWGMKPLGVITSVAGVLSVAALITTDLRATIRPTPLAVVCGAIDLILLVGWLVWFTPEWVRIPADAYAERLLSACETL